MKIVGSDPERIEALRRMRLLGLAGFQDLYCEFLAGGLLGPVRVIAVETDGRTAAYAIVSGTGLVYEFFVVPQHGLRGEDIFCRIIKELNIRGIMAQTFDAAILNPALRLGWPYRVLGCLYRDLLKIAAPALGELVVRPAASADVPLLLAQKDDVFAPKERLAREVESGSVFLFHDAGQLAGCGFLTRIHQDFPNVDLGVWTDPGQRGRGVAKRIIGYLRDLSLERGLIPQCGCDVLNLASRRVLACNGFISRFSLLEFSDPNHR